MSGVAKVRVTKTRQKHPAVKQTKPGRPVNGPNLVGQKEGSTKKAARRSRST